jgi:D-glycero-D-manno-heptose 1,7-bisphosphate phosphatase
MRNRAIFIDKDGTLIQDVPYNVDPAMIQLLPGVKETLAQLKRDRFLLILVSNQSGVARGFFDEAALDRVVTQITHLLEGVQLDGFYFCPHHPEGKIEKYAINCLCRKPEPGMLLSAAAEYGIDLGKSWMIGDILNDIEAGKRAGCKTILLDTGNETEWLVNDLRQPDFLVHSWQEAGDAILRTHSYAPLH